MDLYIGIGGPYLIYCNINFMVKKSKEEINHGKNVMEGLQDLAIDESSEDTLTEPEVS